VRVLLFGATGTIGQAFLLFAPLAVAFPQFSRHSIMGGFKFEAQRALKIDETPLRVF